MVAVKRLRSSRKSLALIGVGFIIAYALATFYLFSGDDGHFVDLEEKYIDDINARLVAPAAWYPHEHDIGETMLHDGAATHGLELALVKIDPFNFEDPSWSNKTDDERRTLMTVIQKDVERGYFGYVLEDSELVRYRDRWAIVGTNFEFSHAGQHNAAINLILPDNNGTIYRVYAQIKQDLFEQEKPAMEQVLNSFEFL